jgi:hypothetical protein
MATFKQILSTTIEQVFSVQVASAAKQVEATAKQAIKQLYPSEQEVVDLVKQEAVVVIRNVAKKMVYHLLGVEENNGSQSYRDYEDGMDLLASKFQPDIDAILRQTDVGKMMQDAVTDELRRYQQSREFKVRVKEIAKDQTHDLVNASLKKAAKRCCFGDLTVEEEEFGCTTVSLDKDGVLSSGTVEEEDQNE